MKKLPIISSLLSFGTALVIPVAVFAQNSSYVDYWVTTASGWLSKALVVIMVLMTLWFLIGVFRYIAEKDPGKLAEKRKTMLSGLVGLFIAVSVWGIISIAGNIFGTKYTSAPAISCPPGTINNGTGGCYIP
ncbi:MAG TPA: hypothetical protein VG621_03800 [Candidatus Paceibacterota bacterium]|nr:hypothetical protein [Candidatus Paceibacterota bacterium]